MRHYLIRLRAGIAIMVLMAASPLISSGADLKSVAAFDAANRFFEEGRYQEAIAGYQELLRSGHRNAAVYYNLGNSLFKSGHVGRAIAAYRVAERVTPRDPDVQANLRFARARVEGPSMRPVWWREWVQRLTLNEWTWMAMVAVWVILLLLAWRQWKPVLKPALRAWVVLSGVVTVLLCVGFATAYHLRRDPVAVVTTPIVEARNGPLDESQTAFTLHDGAELRVIDRKGDWLRIYADPRHLGWVKTNQVTVIAGL